jgi:xanthine dehydrogenase YagT iron-sulfur-binding subunit
MTRSNPTRGDVVDRKRGCRQRRGRRTCCCQRSRDTRARDADAAVPPGAVVAPAALEVTLRVNGTEHRLALDSRTTLLDALPRALATYGLEERLRSRPVRRLHGADRRQAHQVVPRRWRPRGRAARSRPSKGWPRRASSIQLQAAFIERDAFQCGYCTAGQIMAGVACIEEGHCGSAQEIREWMSGNLCRCGAYGPSSRAIQDCGRT